MAKYSEVFKLRMVKEYLEGSLGYDLLAQKYSIPSSTPIKRWVRAFQENPDAFLDKHKQRWRSNSTKKDSD